MVRLSVEKPSLHQTLWLICDAESRFI